MKKGFTMVSLVIYVTLFFAFTLFAASISTNMNYKILSEKGRIIINDNYMKLYVNFLNSAKNSYSVDIIGDNITFSNGDIYKFDDSKKTIIKNSSKLVDNIKEFNIKNVEETNGLSNDFNFIDIDKCFAFNISFQKYNATLNKDIIVSVGDDLYE